MKKLKVGVIGVGNISKEHIQAYLNNPQVELYAFCDINEQQLKSMAEKYGVSRIFTDKEEMLALPELDAVSICTWNSEHAPCTIAALNAGKHVLCEKPMAITVEEALSMKEAAERNKKLLQIGFVRRFGNDCKVLKDFIQQDFFGRNLLRKSNLSSPQRQPNGLVRRSLTLGQRSSH